MVKNGVLGTSISTPRFSIFKSNRDILKLSPKLLL